MVALPTLVRRRATDEVYDAIRHSILTHRYAPGQRLKIEEMALQLGVSLTPVRHAIQQLSAEGLIEIRPRSGTFVASLLTADIRETFEVRRALECLAAERSAETISAGDLKRLRMLCWELARPVETESDRAEHESRNSEFHHVLVAASGNHRLLQMYEGLKAHLQIARVHGAGFGEWKQRLAAERDEHGEILAAVEARNASELAAALRRHIDRARDSLIESIENNT